MDGLLWVFVALSIMSVDIAVAVWWFRRRRRAAAGSSIPVTHGAQEEMPHDPGESFVPTDQGVRMEQLKTIARLRDSGALSEGEFTAEKRRILDGL